jgi:hypothetical protein
MRTAPVAGAVLSIFILLTVLLALCMAAILRSPPWTPQHAGDDEPASQPRPPAPAAKPPTAPLPRRVAGESGRVAPATGQTDAVPDVIQPSRVSGSPPWGPAPEPHGPPPRDML